MRMGWMVLAGLLVTQTARAGGIEVTQSGGQSLAEAGPTELHFTSMLPGKVVSIEQVTSTSAAVATGYNYSASAYGQTTTPLCTTPCSLTLDPGSYTLRAGRTIYSPVLNIEATGGERSWEVREVRPGRLVGGIMGTGIGLGIVLGGGIALAVDPELGAPIAAAGLPISAIGIPLLISGMGKIRER